MIVTPNMGDCGPIGKLEAESFPESVVKFVCFVMSPTFFHKEDSPKLNRNVKPSQPSRLQRREVHLAQYPPESTPRKNLLKQGKQSPDKKNIK